MWYVGEFDRHRAPAVDTALAVLRAIELGERQELIDQLNF